jgi:DNA-binding IclR family transcriptional regulator
MKKIAKAETIGMPNEITRTIASRKAGFIAPEADGGRTQTVAQTLVRGIELLAVIARGSRNLPELAEAVGLTKSTTHRLAATLVEHRLLNFAPRVGYSLGPRLMELGYMASRQMSLPSIAHDFLVRLAALTGDTVHLGILDDDRVLYLDKVAGSRRIEVSSRIGERQPLRSTGLGKALLLSSDIKTLTKIYEREAKEFPNYGVSFEDWVQRMSQYAVDGFALDLSENENDIRCVAAPVRDASAKIIGAISVTSAAQYMDDGRMSLLTAYVKRAADEISSEFGWKNYMAAV